jgi:hypothetical protein
LKTIILNSIHVWFCSFCYVLLIGLYELLGNLTTQLIEPLTLIYIFFNSIKTYRVRLHFMFLLLITKWTKSDMNWIQDNCFQKLKNIYIRVRGSMSWVVRLPSNSYKPISNTAWVRSRLCKLQKKVQMIKFTSYLSFNSCPNLTIFFINESRKIVPFFSFFSSNLHDLNTDLIYCLQIYKSTIIVLCLGRN